MFHLKNLPYYHIVEDEDWSDCVTIGSEDSDIEEIDKDEVRDTLKELADLKRKEADILDKLAQAVPKMQDSEVVVVSEKVGGQIYTSVFMICMEELTIHIILEQL